jgi:hypothetical protein
MGTTAQRPAIVDFFEATANFRWGSEGDPIREPTELLSLPEKPEDMDGCWWLGGAGRGWAGGADGDGDAREGQGTFDVASIHVKLEPS